MAEKSGPVNFLTNLKSGCNEKKLCRCPNNVLDFYEVVKYVMKNASELQVVLVSNFASFIQFTQSVIMVYLSNKDWT